MIRRLSDLALNNCFRVLRLAILPDRMGRCLVPKPSVEAYPHVANNYVEIITPWPGIAAEEVEQQVTTPSRS
jgi:cobalt-zinc-cadmium resistance protein CzcA